ncbi:MAG: hypothetical protein HYS98_00185 [Deltaproteobacteria bacterium]|nr:hypothetical protein [Deltaproteobacteria bacterium]
MKLYFLIFILCLSLFHCSTAPSKNSDLSHNPTQRSTASNDLSDPSDPGWVGKNIQFNKIHIGVSASVQIPSSQSLIQGFLQSDDRALKEFQSKLLGFLKSTVKKYFSEFEKQENEIEKSFGIIFQEDKLVPYIDKRFYKENKEDSSQLFCYSIAVISTEDFQKSFNHVLESHFRSNFETQEIFEKNLTLFWQELIKEK